jgi:hypothetical protein
MVGENMSSKTFYEMMKEGKPPTIIRHYGQPNEIEIDGKKIFRKEKMHIPKIGTVMCAPYDNHFVYRYTGKKGWTLFCTCGSAAVITGYDMYKDNSKGAILGCYSHLMEGHHADGSN